MHVFLHVKKPIENAHLFQGKPTEESGIWTKTQQKGKVTFGNFSETATGFQKKYFR